MVSLMIQNRFALALTSGLAFGLAACGGSSSSPGTSGSGAAMNVSVVSNGFGQLLPHTTTRLVNDEPSTQIIELRTIDDLVANVRANNPVLAGPIYPTSPILPTGQDGNQFMYARFTQPLMLDSILDPSPGGQASQGLTGAISVVALNPMTGETSPVQGRAFVGGQTYSGVVSGTPPLLPLQTWVELDGNGKPVATTVNGETPGLGFPGTQDDFGGSAELLSPNTFTFVVDSDGDLSTHESFPAGRHIRMRISTAVRGTGGAALQEQALASSLVGADTIAPEVLVAPPPLMSPQISPGNGDQNVDPMTDIRIEFSEPIQPLSLGDLPTGSPPDLSAAMQLMFGPSTSQTEVPFTILPVSIYDFSTWRLTPVFNFPGEGPAGQACGVFNRVDVFANTSQFLDLAGNTNSVPANTFFVTGEGPGLVNAPVAPEAIYVGFAGSNPGIGIVDLNGFGQTTGNPAFTASSPVLIEGESNFPNNPNVRFQGALMRPALTPGTCTFNGGSPGIFRLILDSSLNSLLVRAPIALTINDMMLGHALDSTFNNGPSPFGCQSGGQNVGGNLCAQNGRKMIQAIQTGPNTMGPPINNNPIILTSDGENLISWAPHPNPPALIFPPPCVQPFLGGQEPTSTDTVGAGLANLLVPAANPFGQPLLGIPPAGLLTTEQNTWFYGPSLPQAQVAACAPYFIRQQIGQFMYVIDRGRRELIILNSNRLSVIDRIQLPDPTQMAMSPNLDTLAISNQDTDTVSFIDINPTSATFHRVIHTAVVGNRPSGIAWEPGNEDILVANEADSSVTVISGFSLDARRTVSSNLNEPFDVAITPRQTNFGFQRNVYFAYVLNRNGRVALFESGPDDVGGWGFDNIIGVAPTTFTSPQAIQPDHIDLRSAVWIAHAGPIDLKTENPLNSTEGAVSKLGIVSGLIGQVPLGGLLNALIPNLRSLVIGVTASVGEAELSGRPVDIAFDNLRNYGGLANVFTSFSAGVPLPSNGKALVRAVGGGPVNTNEPRFMFAAVPFPTSGSGSIDVINIGAGFTILDTNPFQPGTQSIPAPGVSLVMDYFRQ